MTCEYYVLLCIVEVGLIEKPNLEKKKNLTKDSCMKELPPLPFSLLPCFLCVFFLITLLFENRTLVSIWIHRKLFVESLTFSPQRIALLWRVAMGDRTQCCQHKVGEAMTLFFFCFVARHAQDCCCSPLNGGR